MEVTITNTIKYIGTNDKDLDLFESQYIVPNGMAYNSYLIMDEKVAVMAAADKRMIEEWLANIAAALGDKAHQDEDVLSYALFDQVALKFFEKRDQQSAIESALSNAAEAKYHVNIHEVK